MSCTKLVTVAPILNRVLSKAPLVGREFARRYYWPSRRNAISIWDPFTEMQRSMDRMIRDFDRWTPLAMTPKLFDRRLVPTETTVDGQRVYKIELELPDFKPENINVTVKDNLVTVKAKHEADSDGYKQSREYTYQYALPVGANIEQIRSSLESNGVLTIEAPLPAIEEPKAKQIPVTKE